MNQNIRTIFLYTLIVLAAASTRLVPHAWNFAPVSAVAIVAGIYLPLRTALILPAAVRLFSDLIIGFFSWPLMIAVYASHIFGGVLGHWAGKRKTFTRVAGAPLISAGIFFLVTNFAYLYSPSAYPHTFSGIIQAYANGLPFLRGTLLGDLGYTLALVAGIEGIRYWQARWTRDLFSRQEI